MRRRTSYFTLHLGGLSLLGPIHGCGVPFCDVYPTHEECIAPVADESSEGTEATSTTNATTSVDTESGMDSDASSESSTASDSTDASTETTGGPPAPATLEISLSPAKQFDFVWSPAAGAQTYEVWWSPDGAIDNFVPLATSVTETSLSLTVPLYLQPDSSYLLKACNGDGCSDSEPVVVMGSMVEAVGTLDADSLGSPSDEFGASVASSMDGSYLAVGAPKEDGSTTAINGPVDDAASAAGAVYIFYHLGGGTWELQASIKASDAQAGDQFGTAVALSSDGTTLAVGSPYEDDAGVDSGAVYIYSRQARSWNQQQRLKPVSLGAGDEYGRRLALDADGDTLAVAAWREDSGTLDPADNGLSNAGAVFLHTRINDTWPAMETRYVKAAVPEQNEYFGTSVALSGDGLILAVGAYGHQGSIGAIYAYGVSQGDWALADGAPLVSGDADGGTQFGWSVALDGDGDTLAVGAPMAGGGGGVYLASRTGSTWTPNPAASLEVQGVELGDSFGCDLSLSSDGSRLAVGAYTEDGGAEGIGGDPTSNGMTSAGAVFMFERVVDSWSLHTLVKAPDPQDAGRMGWSLALSRDGQTLLVGAIGVDQLGATYLY